MEEVLTENEVTNEEIPSEEVEDDGIELASDEPEEEELSFEELKAKYKELEEKNRNAEEIAKRLKDEKSQRNREASNQEDTESQQQAKVEITTKAVEDLMLNGDFSEESLERLTEAGYSETEIKLMKYEANDAKNRIFSYVGGEEAYRTMTETVKEHVSEAEVKSFEKLLSNPETVEIAMLALKQRYSEVSGNTATPSKITPNATKASSTSTYKSEQDYFKDMRTMRSLPTQQQKAYYDKIQEKLNRSNF